jgi:hypothetical protein
VVSEREPVQEQRATAQDRARVFLSNVICITRTSVQGGYGRLVPPNLVPAGSPVPPSLRAPPGRFFRAPPGGVTLFVLGGPRVRLSSPTGLSDYLPAPAAPDWSASRNALRSNEPDFWLGGNSWKLFRKSATSACAGIKVQSLTAHQISYAPD